MHCQNATYDVFVDLDTEGQRDLLGNSRAAPTGITPFHFNDGIDEFFGRSFRTSPTAVFGGEQLSVLSFDQHLVEMQQSRRPENDRGSHNPCRRHEKGAQTGDNPIRNAEVGSSFPTAIQNQQLMSHQRRFSNDGPESTRPCKSQYGDDHMNEKDEDVAHGGMVSDIETPNSAQSGNSPSTGGVVMPLVRGWCKVFGAGFRFFRCRLICIRNIFSGGTART